MANLLELEVNDLTKFNIDTITESLQDGAIGFLTIRIPVHSEPIQPIWNAITPSNMAHIKVYENGSLTDEYTGYTFIESIEKVIDRFNKFISVRARRPQ